MAGNVLVRQLVRSATSVGANYRAACHARSKADFVAKLCIAQEECDESVYWIELLGAMNILAIETTMSLHKEGRELTAMLTSSIKTARAHL
jgi:four helix bundle protein